MKINEKKWIPEEKCKGCSALGHCETWGVGYYCMSAMCIKEYKYDPETRIWLPIPNLGKEWNKIKGKSEESVIKNG